MILPGIHTLATHERSNLKVILTPPPATGRQAPVTTLEFG